ncbi:unnamed protein product [Effrenium voratum]|uniref:Uncharacterized protein n=1 Tax=Effrenium voratum TaxID=2562239 RepID=A0AA36I551_9DINO|nr:unnamed protein product [Effrenium voratum]
MEYAVLRELRQLKEEHQALKDCLCATGLLTQAELAKHAQRLQASQFHRVLRSPALVRHLAVLVGIRSMTHFASTSSTASAACRSLLLMSQGPTHADVQGGPVLQGLFGRLFSKGAEGHGKEPDEPHDHAGEKEG